MTTLLKPFIVYQELVKRNMKIFTPLEFTRVFHSSHTQTKYFLERQTQEGLLIRLKQGMYTLTLHPPSEEEIANALYKPSYISFEYALAYYHVIPESPYMVTSATSKPTRLFTVDGKTFAYQTIKKRAYTGYQLVRKNSKVFVIAEQEKAIVDFLYLVAIGQKMENNRLRVMSNEIDKHKIHEYAALFDRPKLYQLIQKYVVT